jgi:hypothetical protein
MKKSRNLKRVIYKKWKAYKEGKYEQAAHYRKKECRMLGIETSFEKFLKINFNPS